MNATASRVKYESIINGYVGALYAMGVEFEYYGGNDEPMGNWACLCDTCIEPYNLNEFLKSVRHD